ncbi:MULTISPECIES: hypothetical protein [Paenibacillus]|jgi:hypothetical protein|uniref:Uncharacterized protein n=1 Tax=Paenibacillus azoreducens TaxID=116718 RepID=A0A919Y6H9_9BACL|nr:MULTISPECIES: hypothetical protein [Paenibacillus]MBE9912500.1 hypothetical protein [Paenibacillus donghaensis]GIO45846.1 hypothetical protein J34TS1_06110 [Paenibacillus azoreducens]
MEPHQSPQHLQQQMRHTGPGIASFIISLVSMLAYIISVGAMGAIFANGFANDHSWTQSSTTGVTVVTLILIGLFAANILGIVLGIVGMVIRNRKKIFAILGLSLNTIIILSFGLMFVILMLRAGR